VSGRIDPVAQWMRQLGTLRSQAAKQTRGGPIDTLTNEALSLCDSLIRELAGIRLDADRLRAALRDANAATDALIQSIPTACVLTDSAGFIVDANHGAGRLLNFSAKKLLDRELVVFGEDRTAFKMLLQRLPHESGHVLETLKLRPRERKPTSVDVRVLPAPYRPGHWLWFLSHQKDAPPVSQTEDTGMASHSTPLDATAS
jgi:PAS domain-containing protein